MKPFSTILFILVLLCCQITANAQDTSYAVINMPALLKHPNVNRETVQVMYKRNLQFLFDAFAGYLKETKSNKEKDASAKQFILMKKSFDQCKEFPDSITAGWHLVVMTDNDQFCKLAKVLVSKNSVVQLAIEDCIRIRCTSKEPIKNASAVIVLTDLVGGTEPLEVFFVNDLDGPALADEPTQPGYVCFWTSMSSLLHERLLIDGIRRDMISQLRNEPPNCLETGVSFYIMKPGKHFLRATKTGNDRESNFIIKSGMCLTYRIK